MLGGSYSWQLSSWPACSGAYTVNRRTRCNLGAQLVRIGFWVHSTTIVLRLRRNSTASLLQICRPLYRCLVLHVFQELDQVTTAPESTPDLGLQSKQTHHLKQTGPNLSGPWQNPMRLKPESHNPNSLNTKALRQGHG